MLRDVPGRQGTCATLTGLLVLRTGGGFSRGDRVAWYLGYPGPRTATTRRGRLRLGVSRESQHPREHPHADNHDINLLQGIGYGVTAAGFALQIPARLACEKLSGGLRLVVADAYQFLCFCGTVNLWRGVWNLLNVYLLPGKSQFMLL